MKTAASMFHRETHHSAPARQALCWQRWIRAQPSIRECGLAGESRRRQSRQAREPQLKHWSKKKYGGPTQALASMTPLDSSSSGGLDGTERGGRGPRDTIPPGKISGEPEQRSNHPALDHCIQVATVERPTIKPQLDPLRQHFLDLLASRRELASNRGMHLVIVVKHGWRAQVLHGANRGVPHNVGHRKPSPSQPDLDENDAHLRQRGIGKRRLRIGTGAANNGSVNGGSGADQDYQERSKRRLSQ